MKNKKKLLLFVVNFFIHKNCLMSAGGALKFRACPQLSTSYASRIKKVSDYYDAITIAIDPVIKIRQERESTGGSGVGMVVLGEINQGQNKEIHVIDDYSERTRSPEKQSSKDFNAFCQLFKCLIKYAEKTEKIFICVENNIHKADGYLESAYLFESIYNIINTKKILISFLEYSAINSNTNKNSHRQKKRVALSQNTNPPPLRKKREEKAIRKQCKNSGGRGNQEEEIIQPHESQYIKISRCKILKKYLKKKKMLFFNEEMFLIKNKKYEPFFSVCFSEDKQTKYLDILDALHLGIYSICTESYHQIIFNIINENIFALTLLNKKLTEELQNKEELQKVSKEYDYKIDSESQENTLNEGDKLSNIIESINTLQNAIREFKDKKYIPKKTESLENTEDQTSDFQNNKKYTKEAINLENEGKKFKEFEEQKKKIKDDIKKLSDNINLFRKNLFKNVISFNIFNYSFCRRGGETIIKMEAITKNMAVFLDEVKKVNNSLKKQKKNFFNFMDSACKAQLYEAIQGAYTKAKNSIDGDTHLINFILKCQKCFQSDDLPSILTMNTNITTILIDQLSGKIKQILEQNNNLSEDEQKKRIGEKIRESFPTLTEEIVEKFAKRFIIDFKDNCNNSNQYPHSSCTNDIVLDDIGFQCHKCLQEQNNRTNL